MRGIQPSTGKAKRKRISGQGKSSKCKGTEVGMIMCLRTDWPYGWNWEWYGGTSWNEVENEAQGRNCRVLYSVLRSLNFIWHRVGS